MDKVPENKEERIFICLKCKKEFGSKQHDLYCPTCINESEERE